MCLKCIACNPSEAFRVRSVSRHMRLPNKGRGYPCRSVISIKLQNSSFVGITPLREVFPCQWDFGTAYHGTVSEALLSIHHKLQIHCIVNVSICIKVTDDKIIVFCSSLQILTYNYLIKYFCKIKKGKKGVLHKWYIFRYLLGKEAKLRWKWT